MAGRFLERDQGSLMYAIENPLQSTTLSIYRGPQGRDIFAARSEAKYREALRVRYYSLAYTSVVTVLVLLDNPGTRVSHFFTFLSSL